MQGMGIVDLAEETLEVHREEGIGAAEAVVGDGDDRCAAGDGLRVPCSEGPCGQMGLSREGAKGKKITVLQVYNHLLEKKRQQYSTMSYGLDPERVPTYETGLKCPNKNPDPHL